MNNTHDLVTVFSLPSCVQCEATVRFLDQRDVQYRLVDLSQDQDATVFVKSKGFVSAPVVLTPGGEMFSGFNPEELTKLVAQKG